MKASLPVLHRSAAVCVCVLVCVRAHAVGPGVRSVGTRLPQQQAPTVQVTHHWERERERERENESETERESLREKECGSQAPEPHRSASE